MKRRINSVKPPESNTTDNYIDDDSKWPYNEFRGAKLYGFYSRTNAENPVLLYASAEEQAEFEFMEPEKITKELAYGSNRRFETLDKWVGAYGLLKNGNHSDMHKALHTGKAVQNDGLDGRKSRRKPSAAFVSCIQNTSDGRIRELTDSAQYQQRRSPCGERGTEFQKGSDEVDEMTVAELN